MSFEGGGLRSAKERAGVGVAGVIALLGAVGAANVASYRATFAPEQLTVLQTEDDVHPPPAGVATLRWTELAQTRRGPAGEPRFAPGVVALAGRQVEVSGFAFLVKSGIERGEVLQLVVMPPTLATCCGPTCTPALEKIVYIDCSEAPLPRTLWSQAGLYARVVGTLALADSSSLGCLFTLRGARARLYEVDGDGQRAKLVFDASQEQP